MKTVTNLIVAVLLLAGVSGTCRAESIVYAQPYTTGGYNAWASSTTPDGNPTITYDNFTLAASANITTITWQGIYTDSTNPGANPESIDTASFVISFWSDNGGQPGTMLSTGTVSIADANAVALADVGFYFADAGVTENVPSYVYSALLPTAFAAHAGQTYWVSIVSSNSADEPLWDWVSGTGGDGLTIQDIPVGREQRAADRAFTLNSTELPTVNVAATTSRTGPGQAPGVFTITFSNPQTNKVKVHYTVKGTAVNGTDYTMLTGVVKVKAGTTSTTLDVVPSAETSSGVKKVKLQIEASGAYTLGSSITAQVKIVDP